MSGNNAGLHVKVDAYHISLLPFAVYAEISVLERGLYSFSIYLNGVSGGLAVRVAVKVSGNYLVSDPSGYADVQAELAGSLIDGNLYIAVPGILCGLGYLNVLAVYLRGKGVGHKEVYKQLVVLNGIYVTGY